MAVFLGIAKGFRTVYMTLLVPSYVPIEKLANASGMQMAGNGLALLIGGPLLGTWICVDNNNIYPVSIYWLSFF